MCLKKHLNVNVNWVRQSIEKLNKRKSSDFKIKKKKLKQTKFYLNPKSPIPLIIMYNDCDLIFPFSLELSKHYYSL